MSPTTGGSAVRDSNCLANEVNRSLRQFFAPPRNRLAPAPQKPGNQPCPQAGIMASLTAVLRPLMPILPGGMVSFIVFLQVTKTANVMKLQQMHGKKQEFLMDIYIITEKMTTGGLLEKQDLVDLIQRFSMILEKKHVDQTANLVVIVVNMLKSGTMYLWNSIKMRMANTLN